MNRLIQVFTFLMLYGTFSICSAHLYMYMNIAIQRGDIVKWLEQLSYSAESRRKVMQFFSFKLSFQKFIRRKINEQLKRLTCFMTL